MEQWITGYLCGIIKIDHQIHILETKWYLADEKFPILIFIEALIHKSPPSHLLYETGNGPVLCCHDNDNITQPKHIKKMTMLL